MDSSIVTYLVVAAFVVILGISYIRFKKREEDGILQQPNTDIKQTMSEVRDYLALREDVWVNFWQEPRLQRNN